MAIHPTAVVDPAAQLGDAEIGPYSVIGPRVKLADGVVIGAHVVVEGDTTIGAGTRVHPFACLGGEPQDLKFAGEDSRLVIGEKNIIREYVTMHRGTEGGGSLTLVGDKNIFMASSHVAHDCKVGSRCVLANSVALGGHVVVEDRAVLGGLAGVHQFARVGRCAMVAAGSMVSLDVPPFTLAHGDRARLYGLNVMGLKRAYFEADTISALRKAYRELFGGAAPLRMAVEKLRAESEVPEVLELAAFLEASVRGVCRAAGSEAQAE